MAGGSTWGQRCSMQITLNSQRQLIVPLCRLADRQERRGNNPSAARASSSPFGAITLADRTTEGRSGCRRPAAASQAARGGAGGPRGQERAPWATLSQTRGKNVMRRCEVPGAVVRLPPIAAAAAALLGHLGHGPILHTLQLPCFKHCIPLSDDADSFLEQRQATWLCGATAAGRLPHAMRHPLLLPCCFQTRQFGIAVDSNSAAQHKVPGHTAPPATPGTELPLHSSRHCPAVFRCIPSSSTAQCPPRFRLLAGVADLQLQCRLQQTTTRGAEAARTVPPALTREVGTR